MKKIGVLTFHRAINYGAVLQTYALQKFLKRQNFNASVLDYRCLKIEKDYKLNFFTFNIKKLISSLVLLSKKFKFNKFINKNIVLTKPVYNKEDLENISKELDYVCVGSDQVWNGRWTDNDKRYYLDFTDSYKKISYAASLGKNAMSLKEKTEYTELLNDFKKLSVREQSSAELLSGFLNKNISTHLDPVFLLEKNEWNKVAKTIRDSNYVLVYMLVPSDNLIKKAIDLAKRKNLNVIILNDNIRKRYNIEYRRFVSIEKFLGYFKNASYVITNSFHGTAFSVVYEKNFFVELQTYKNAPNMRMIDLLKVFDLNERIFDENSDLSIYNNINYHIVNRKKYKMIKEVTDYFNELKDL